MQKNIVYLEKRKGSYFERIIQIFIMLSISWWMASINKGANLSTMESGRFPILLYITGAIGAAGVLALFNLIGDKFQSKLLKFVGVNSIIYLGTQMSLLLNVISVRLLSLVFCADIGDNLFYYLWGCCVVVVMLIIGYPIVVLFNGKLKFLISSLK